MNASLLRLDPTTLVFTVGVLYMMMPLTVWSVLHGRQAPRSARLWCFGAFLSGVAFMLFGLRQWITPVPISLLANAVGYLGLAFRWAALRQERGGPVNAFLLGGLVLLSTALYMLAFEFASTRHRLVYLGLVLLIAAVFMAREAQLLARRSDSRSARMIAVTYGLVAAAALFRLVVVLLQQREPVPFEFTPDALLLQAAGLASALWGNIGYLGVAMERAQAAESAGRAALAAATARHETAERQAAELKALSDERQELLRVISHEVRQPLHNAQAVLHGVETSLQRHPVHGDAQAAIAFSRARTVLRQITSSLDNTLAASTVLVGNDLPSRRDADVEMLVELCLGDLAAADRSRVNVDYSAGVRTAAMDVGLMRLALRNLLDNALAYSKPGSLVTLRVIDCDEPLALVIEVADLGPPIDPKLQPRLFQRGIRGRHDLPGQGLGLYIVRQAMRRQGGTAEVHTNALGNCFVLTIPQDQEAA